MHRMRRIVRLLERMARSNNPNRALARRLDRAAWSECGWGEAPWYSVEVTEYL